MTQIDNALGRKPLLLPLLLEGEGEAAAAAAAEAAARGGGQQKQKQQKQLLFGYGIAMGPFEMAGESCTGEREKERKRGEEKQLSK